MHEFTSAKKYYYLMKYMNLLSAKKTNMKMHKHTGDDRGTDLVFRMMLAEQAMLARSQHELQQLILLVVAVIKNHQVQPLHQNNHQSKTDGNANNNARIARSSFISIETKSTKSSGAPLSQVIGLLLPTMWRVRFPTFFLHTDTQTPWSKPIKITK